jgi:hypothetical protein
LKSSPCLRNIKPAEAALLHYPQPVAFLKPLNGTGHILGIQHRNQLGDCFVGIARAPRSAMMRPASRTVEISNS